MAAARVANVRRPITTGTSAGGGGGGAGPCSATASGVDRRQRALDACETRKAEPRLHVTEASTTTERTLVQTIDTYSIVVAGPLSHNGFYKTDLSPVVFQLMCAGTPTSRQVPPPRILHGFYVRFLHCVEFPLTHALSGETRDWP